MRKTKEQFKKKDFESLKQTCWKLETNYVW